MKYMLGFKSFNEGLFNDNENDDQVGTEILNKLSKLEYEVVLLDKLKYMAINLKLDKNLGTYNVIIDSLELKLEYYKEDKLQFNYILKCNPTIRNSIFKTIQDNYLSENNI